MDDQKNLDKSVETPINSVPTSNAPETLATPDIQVKPEVHESVTAPIVEQPPAPVSTPVQTPINIQPQPVVPDPSPLLPADIPENINDLDAAEGHVIEKPWVNAAEDIIKRDEGNPYLEEEDHEDLQIKYLKKRFGKEIRKEEE